MTLADKDQISAGRIEPSILEVDKDCALAEKPKALQNEMSGAEFSDELDRAGFRQTKFSDFIGVDQRTIRKWIKSAPPLYGVRLIKLYQAQHIAEAPSPRDTTLETAKEAVKPVLRSILNTAADERFWPKEYLASILDELAAEMREEAKDQPKPQPIRISIPRP